VFSYAVLNTYCGIERTVQVSGLEREMLPIFTTLQKPYPPTSGGRAQKRSVSASPLVRLLGLVKVPGLQCLLEMEISMLEFQQGIRYVVPCAEL